MPADTGLPSPLRAWMLALLTFGLIGLATELILLEHYEEPTMAIPFAAIAAALGAIVFVVWKPGRASLRALRVVMSLFVLVGAIGVLLHYRGSLAFQVDMDPTAPAWSLFWKVMHMKAPPTLAPGAMVQLGLLGLLVTYRHPLLTMSGRAFPKGESS